MKPMTPMIWPVEDCAEKKDDPGVLSSDVLSGVSVCESCENICFRAAAMKERTSSCCSGVTEAMVHSGEEADIIGCGAWGRPKRGYTYVCV